MILSLFPLDLPSLRELHMGCYALGTTRYFRGFSLTLRDLPKLETLQSRGMSFQWVEKVIIESGRRADV